MNYCDLQINGYAGADFSSLDLTDEQLHRACVALKEDGVETILATIITDHLDSLCAKLRHLLNLRERGILLSVATGAPVDLPLDREIARAHFDDES